MKGQMFLVAGIIIALGLVFMRGVYDIGPLFEENIKIRSNDNYLINNLKKEYQETVSFGVNENSVSQYLYNFSHFLYEDIGGFSAFYVYLDLENYSMVAGNFMDNSLVFNASLSNCSPSEFSAVIGNQNYTVFEINSMDNFEANISYGKYEVSFNSSLNSKGILFTNIGVDGFDKNLRKKSVHRVKK